MTKQTPNSNTSWTTVLGLGLAGSLIAGFIALAFLWPAKTAEPHEYPIAITGNNSQQLAAIKQGLEQTVGDTISLVDVSDRNEAVDKIKNREVFGALVLNMPNPEVLTASGNGQAANAPATAMATNLQLKLNEMTAKQTSKNIGIPNPTVKTTDVVSLHNAKFDIAQLALPLVFAGIIGGTSTALFIRGRWQRVGALTAYSLLAGCVLYLVLHSWFDILPAGFWTLSGALSLGIFATASLIAGSYVVAGVRGMALAVMFTLLFANPISGIALPPQFLPEPWGAIGQGLTVGAAGTLLRGAAYFPTADAITAPIIVLCTWSLLGAVALITRNRDSIKS